MPPCTAQHPLELPRCARRLKRGATARADMPAETAVREAIFSGAGGPAVAEGAPPAAPPLVGERDGGS